ncbi:MAG: hypothetical protein ABI999_10335 [Acidobacteriota bacterium]
METFLTPEVKKKGINKIFIIGIVVGLIAVAVGIWLLTFKPPMDQQVAKILEGAYKEGSPEYQDLNKDIVISRDEKNTVESPTGLGTISVFIRGNVHNKGGKTIDILEVNVAMVTQFKQVLKEKKILVVPVQQAVLGPGETIPITLTLDGFNRDDDRADIRWKVTAIHAKN